MTACTGIAQPWQTAPSAIWMFWISVAWIRVRLRVWGAGLGSGMGSRVRLRLRDGDTVRIRVRVRVSGLGLGLRRHLRLGDGAFGVEGERLERAAEAIARRGVAGEREHLEGLALAG